MNETLLADLTALGLTQYESKCYLALLADSPANPYQISKRSGVPTAKIYQVVARLVERGMAVEVVGGDGGFVPKDPQIVLAEWQDRHRRLIDRTGTALKRLKTQRSAHLAWNIEGREQVVEQGSRIITSAQSAISVATTPDLLAAWMSDFAAATHRGVHLRIISYGEPPDGSLPARVFRPIQGRPPGTVIAVDQRIACFITTGDSQQAETLAGAWTDNPAIAAIAEEYIDDKLFIENALENHWIMWSDTE